MHEFLPITITKVLAFSIFGWIQERKTLWLKRLYYFKSFATFEAKEVFIYVSCSYSFGTNSAF